MSLPANPLPAERWLTRFGRGLAAPWRGFVYLNRRPLLWRYGVIPVLLNLLITAVVLGVLLLAAVGFAYYLHPLFSREWYGQLAEVLVVVGLIVAAVALGLAIWMLLQGILCGYFYERLARRVELELGTPPEALQDIPWWYQIVDTFRDVAALLGVNAALLLLHLLPVVGSILATGGSLYFGCYLFGRDFLDYPLGLRGLRWKEKAAFTWKHHPTTLGLGAAVFLFEFIPVVGAVIATTAVVGAVLLYHDLEPAATRPRPAGAGPDGPLAVLPADGPVAIEKTDRR